MTQYRSVPVAQLLEWKAHVNTLTALSLKRERYAHGAKLKQQIADVLDAAPDAPQPQREWVGLTDVEWMNIVNKNQAWFGMQPDEVAHEVCKLTEAKLHEKNGGGV